MDDLIPPVIEILGQLTSEKLASITHTSIPWNYLPVNSWTILTKEVVVVFKCSAFILAYLL